MEANAKHHGGHIYFSVDEKFLSLALVPVSQLKDCGRRIILVDAGATALPDWKKDKVKEAWSHVDWIRFSPEENMFSTTPTYHMKQRYPDMVYARLLLPMIMPQEETGLYLDSDIFINGDINEIFDYGLGANELVGGVTDLGTCERDEPYIRNCHISEYINTGVLLMNFSLLRKEQHLYRECYDYVVREKPRFADQDTINDVFQGRKRILPLKFQQTCYSYKFRRMEWIRNPRNTLIYHYCALRAKPWLEEYRDRFPDMPFAAEFNEIYRSENARLGFAV